MRKGSAAIVAALCVLSNILVPDSAFCRTLVVDQEHESAADTNPGTEEKPLKTIQAAEGLAQPGDTVSIKPGVYRETILIHRGGTPEKPITFEAEETRKVIVTGASRLSGWRKDGGDDGVYSTHWPHDVRWYPAPAGHFGGDARDPKEKRTREQVLWRGLPLRAVLAREAMASGTFFVDWDGKRLHVRLPDDGNPEEDHVAACAAQILFAPHCWELFTQGREKAFDKCGYITVRGIVFRYVSNFTTFPAVMMSDGWRLEDCTIERMNGVAVGNFGKDTTISRCVFQDNGYCGYSGIRKNSVVQGCVARRNNLKGLLFGGGIESNGGERLQFTQNIAYSNIASGIWMDDAVREFEVNDNTCFANLNSGISIEVSGPGGVKRNTCYANGDGGVHVSASQRVLVEKNILVGNAWGVGFSEPKRPDGHLEDIVVRNNVIADWQIAALVAEIGDWPENAAKLKKLTIDRNLYAPPLDRPFLRWEFKPYSAVEAATRFGICANDRVRPFRLRQSMLQADGRSARSLQSMSDALAGKRRGDATVLPAFGRTPIREAEGGQWSTWICDLGARWVHVIIPDKSLGRQIHRRVRNFPGPPATLIQAKLTTTTPIVQAIVTKVGPQPIDDDAIEESLWNRKAEE